MHLTRSSPLRDTEAVELVRSGRRSRRVRESACGQIVRDGTPTREVGGDFDGVSLAGHNRPSERQRALIDPCVLNLRLRGRRDELPFFGRVFGKDRIRA